MYETTLSLFDRVNIASCAAERARNNLMNNDRFTGEYQTVKCWTNYRCYIGKRINGEQFHYVEPNGI